jgi:3-dehydroquinate dehydratase/shikimate dehydrogenase
LATLRYATELGAAYVDIELKMAPVFQVALRQNPPKGSPKTKIIVSTHNYECTPSDEVLDDLFRKCKTVGADIVKIATMATSILDATRLLKLMNQRWTSQGAVIALAMGEAGQITRVLAGKYGGFLTFGALSADRASAPGQPTLAALRNVYRLQDQRTESKVYGIIGNPVSHSKSPAIHNAAFKELGLGTDAVYVPLLVDSFQPFLQTIENDSCFRDWQGFSVTIPHKEAALAGATGGADAVTRKIGAANTLIRVDSASTSMFKAYNTDWSAAIGAIERALGGSLKGLAVVVLGAGGAGRALAFGAAAAGADRVVIANRSEQRAHQVAASVGEKAQGTSLEAVASGQVSGDILINTTSVGMAGKSVDKSPLESTDTTSILGRYKLVFDAVYTPLHTKLLQDAQAAGCKVVTGDEMFVGQAADQFLLFTGQQAPTELMRRIVLGGEEE